jgi:hypothetical protein
VGGLAIVGWTIGVIAIMAVLLTLGQWFGYTQAERDYIYDKPYFELKARHDVDTQMVKTQ